MGLITKIFGTRSEREVKKLQPQLDAILALEEEYKALSETELKGIQEVIDRHLQEKPYRQNTTG